MRVSAATRKKFLRKFYAESSLNYTPSFYELEKDTNAILMAAFGSLPKLDPKIVPYVNFFVWLIINHLKDNNIEQAVEIWGGILRLDEDRLLYEFKRRDYLAGGHIHNYYEKGDSYESCTPEWWKFLREMAIKDYKQQRGEPA